MFEKVNPDHPDKQADRIAGAIVDYAYSVEKDPRIAVEVLLGHGKCHIIAETSVHINKAFLRRTVARITKSNAIKVDYKEVPQDSHLASNQSNGFRCGDNGIFKGVPVTREQRELVKIAKDIYAKHPYDGKYILDNKFPFGKRLVICQSNASKNELAVEYPYATINPLGDWTGGCGVDSGATNRKLGSDMGDSVTGGGLHGKDLSKADVSLNIYAFLQAQVKDSPVRISCAIGDEYVDNGVIPYSQIVEKARDYIKTIGGFEKFAEWGLLR